MIESQTAEQRRKERNKRKAKERKEAKQRAAHYGKFRGQPVDIHYVRLEGRSIVAVGAYEESKPGDIVVPGAKTKHEALETVFALAYRAAKAQEGNANG